MPLEVVPVRYGVAAHDELARRVRAAKAGDALRAVTVVVPSNHVGVAARRRLAAGQGLAATTFLTVYRLAELLGAAALAGDGRRPVSTPVLLTAVQEELATDAGVFAAVRRHPATEEALVASHRLLADLSVPALDRLATASPQARDVVGLHRRVRRRLRDWYDEADLLEAAVEELERGHPLGAELGPVLVFLPQDLSRRAAALLAVLGRRQPVTVLAGLSGDADADRGVVRTLDAMGVVAPPAPEPDPPAGLQVVTASDADDEVRAAVRQLVGAARRGVAFERMAIVHPAGDTYPTLLHQHLAAAGIPANGAVPDRLADHVAGRTLLALADLAGRPPGRAEVFGVLAGAPLRRPGGPPVPSAAWERLSRLAGVVGHDRADWHDRLTAFAAGRQDEARAKQAEDREALARRLRSEAEGALALRDAVAELLDRLAELRTTTGWRALATAVTRLLDDHLGGDAVRARWPAEERAAAERVDAAVERLAHLDTVAPGADLERFRRALALELDADVGRRGRLGEGVLVGPTSLVAGLELDVVVVVGLVEGSLPTRQRDDALLADRDRERVADELPLAAERQRREHRHLLAAVAAAGHQVVLTAPRGDLRRTTEHVASRWLLDLVAAAHGTRCWSDELLALQAPWLEHVPSFAAGLRRGPPATEQEARLALVLAGQALPGDVALARGQRVRTARSGPAFSAFDANVGPGVVASPAATAQVVAPTRLEAWTACPYAYFVRYLLGVEPVEDPAALLQLSALEQGTLVHRVLEGYVAERIADAAAAGDVDQALLRRHFELACHDAEQRGVTGRPLLWRTQREQLWAHLLAFAGRDAERCRTELAQPLAAELRFGFEGDPLEVGLGDGRVLRFRGSIDRVDRNGGGELVVTDYKYSSTRKYQHLGDDDPTAGGTLLQLPAYALAAQARFDAGRLPLPVHARYAFARPEASGKLPADRALHVDGAVLEAWRRALTVVVEGIEQGRFPSRPGDDGARYAGFVACPACDPDGLGTAELQRRWDRLRQAPELAAYVALVGEDGADA